MAVLKFLGWFFGVAGGMVAVFALIAFLLSLDYNSNDTFRLEDEGSDGYYGD
jgi:hypothetical protein